MTRRMVVAATLAMLVACSSDDDGQSPGSGGSGASAGSGGSAGAAGTSTGGAAGAGTGGAAGAASGDTWESFAKGFFATYCVECHGAGSAKRDYTTIDDVIRDKASIRCGVSPTALAGCGSWPPPGQFPIDNATKSNPKPTAAERDALVAWIDAGLP